VKENEPDLFKRAAVFLLPKDYVRYRLTGHLAMDYSDAAGTLMLDIIGKGWSGEILQAFDIPESLCPPLIESHDFVGTILPQMAARCGLASSGRVFAGGADNACGAIGAGILSQGETMCSIGTSGVILSCEEDRDADFDGKLHFFNHAKKDSFYAMGVTLAAGQSLMWFKDTFAPEISFDALLQNIDNVPAGSNGLLFTPYLSGERTPHADADIRGSFIGVDGAHQLRHFTRAIVEGITLSLRESVEILRSAGKNIQTIVSIGGGAKNETWLQIQADVFQAEVIKLESEQGPAMGAAMLAAVGCGWYPSIEECARKFIRRAKSFQPRPDQAAKYDDLFRLYRYVYPHTRELSIELAKFRL
jgi:xylulokinase